MNDHLQQLHDVESHQDCEKKSQEILAKNSVFQCRKRYKSLKTMYFFQRKNSVNIALRWKILAKNSAF